LAGVKGVTNLIVVKPRSTPSDLKKKIIEALVRSGGARCKNITVKWTEARVTLRGPCGRGRGERSRTPGWAAQALFPWITASPSSF